MINWFDPKADSAWAERIKQERDAWVLHRFSNVSNEVALNYGMQNKSLDSNAQRGYRLKPRDAYSNYNG